MAYVSDGRLFFWWRRWLLAPTTHQRLRCTCWLLASPLAFSYGVDGVYLQGFPGFGDLCFFASSLFQSVSSRLVWDRSFWLELYYWSKIVWLWIFAAQVAFGRGLMVDLFNLKTSVLKVPSLSLKRCKWWCFHLLVSFPLSLFERDPVPVCFRWIHRLELRRTRSCHWSRWWLAWWTRVPATLSVNAWSRSSPLLSS